MMTLKRIGMVSLAMIVLQPAAWAENWEGVYALPAPEGAVIYVDTDSAARKGDLATIYVRTGAASRVLRTFDCERRKAIESWPERKSTDLDEAATAIFEKACKRGWEFWK